MQVQIAVLCDAATDYGGRLCLLGAFETLFARQFPVVHPHCALALRLCFFAEDEGEIRLGIRLLNADGHPVTPPIEPRLNVQLGNDVSFMTRNLVLNLQGLSFPKAGEYALQVVANGESMIEVPLRLVEVAPEA
jgi:hypothetical protein